MSANPKPKNLTEKEKEKDKLNTEYFVIGDLEVIDVVILVLQSL